MYMRKAQGEQVGKKKGTKGEGKRLTECSHLVCPSSGLAVNVAETDEAAGPAIPALCSQKKKKKKKKKKRRERKKEK